MTEPDKLADVIRLDDHRPRPEPALSVEELREIRDRLRELAGSYRESGDDAGTALALVFRRALRDPTANGDDQ